MVQVVINVCYGGFSLSEEGSARLAELGYEDPDSPACRYIDRHDPRLIKVVRELGERANGGYSLLLIEEVDGNQYRIEEDGGYESIETPSNQYWITV